jgi:hypothetical protein
MDTPSSAVSVKSDSAALQGAAQINGEAGVAALHLAQHSDQLQPWCGPQHRQDLTLPERRQRVRPATTTRLCPQGHPKTRIEPCSGAAADTCSGRGDLPGLRSVEVHVQFRLLVDDVCAGHGRLSSG